MQSAKKRVLFLALLLCTLCFACTAHASAENVVKNAELTSGGKFVNKKSGIRYQYSSGKYAKDAWLKIKGSIYHFDGKGYCDTGWFTYKNNRYYADKKTGRLYVRKWRRTSKASYYLRANGTMAKSRFVKIKGKYYYFRSNGKLVKKKMFSADGKYYYADKNGVRQTSTWVTLKGKKYYFNSKGVRVQNKWKKIKKKYYYFDKDGVLATSQWVGDYYVDKNGARMTDCVVDGYYLGSDGKRVEYNSKIEYIFVGDSRTVGMESAVSNSKTLYIGKVSMGYSWLKSTASESLKDALNKKPTAKVIMGFGINDLGNISNYIAYYKTLIKSYPKASFYFMSVNPVNESKAKKNGYSVTNSQIKSFNSKLKEAFPSQYLDTYSYLNKNSFSTSDGIHYTSATYKKLYDYVISKID